MSTYVNNYDALSFYLRKSIITKQHLSSVYQNLQINVQDRYACLSLYKY